jgi:hypothetical protein
VEIRCECDIDLSLRFNTKVWSKKLLKIDPHHKKSMIIGLKIRAKK